MAVTIQGTAFEVTHDRMEECKEMLEQAHPALHRFFQDPDTAFIAVRVSRYVVVEQFQNVQEIMVAPDGAPGEA